MPSSKRPILCPNITNRCVLSGNTMVDEMGPYEIVTAEQQSGVWSWPIFSKLYKNWQRKAFIRQQSLRIRNLKFQEVAADHIGKKLILRYLRGGNHGCSEALLFYKCHLSCDRLLREREIPLNESEIVAVLYGLNTSVAWAEVIKSCFSKFEDRNSGDKLILALNEMKRESLYEIEIGWEHSQLRTELNNDTKFIKDILEEIYIEIYEHKRWNITLMNRE